MREGEWGDQTVPPVGRDGVNPRTVVQEKEERGGDIWTET